MSLKKSTLTKQRSPIEFHDEEALAEEKPLDEDGAATEGEEAPEEISLDDEELNPFGDKWEE